MDNNEKKILQSRLIPEPQKILFGNSKSEYTITTGAKVTLKVADVSHVKKEAVESIFKHYWNAVPSLQVTADAVSKKIHKEGYTIKVTDEMLTISASTFQGIDYALKTLRQLAEVERGVYEFSNYFLPQCEITDAPALDFRGIHLCIFPETPLWFTEKQIRLAAYYKFNHVVIEPWGIFPFASHPEFCWKDKAVSRSEFKHLIDIAKEVGITLVPQLNILGHATASRSVTGKHAILDFNPKLQSLFEPDGWTWCISNPETRRVLTDLVLELHDFFERPAYFHIGCDEADNIGTCRDCRRQVLKDLVLDHIKYFHDILAERGAKCIMWHDMLLKRDDPRWKNYIVCGLPEHKLDQLYKELPHDIIIADWQYGYPKIDGAEPTWPTSKFFKKEKFDVLVCPWINAEGSYSLGAMAKKEKLKGILHTTWHKNYGNDYFQIYFPAADAAWGMNRERKPNDIEACRLALAMHTRQIGWDMNVMNYNETGFAENQIPPETCNWG